MVSQAIQIGNDTRRQSDSLDPLDGLGQVTTGVLGFSSSDSNNLSSNVREGGLTVAGSISMLCRQYQISRSKTTHDKTAQNPRNRPLVPLIPMYWTNGPGSFQNLNPIFSPSGPPPAVRMIPRMMSPTIVRTLMMQNQNSVSPYQDTVSRSAPMKASCKVVDRSSPLT